MALPLTSISLVFYSCFFFFCKQKTAYEMRISDWSSDVCSSDLVTGNAQMQADRHHLRRARALAIKHVESIAQGLEELARGRDGSAHELGVVVREAVGDDEMGPAQHGHPIGDRTSGV